MAQPLIRMLNLALPLLEVGLGGLVVDGGHLIVEDSESARDGTVSLRHGELLILSFHAMQAVEVHLGVVDALGGEARYLALGAEDVAHAGLHAPDVHTGCGIDGVLRRSGLEDGPPHVVEFVDQASSGEKHYVGASQDRKSTRLNSSHGYQTYAV